MLYMIIKFRYGVLEIYNIASYSIADELTSMFPSRSKNWDASIISIQNTSREPLCKIVGWEQEDIIIAQSFINPVWRQSATINHKLIFIDDFLLQVFFVFIRSYWAIDCQSQFVGI